MDTETREAIAEIRGELTANRAMLEAASTEREALTSSIIDELERRATPNALTLLEITQARAALAELDGLLRRLAAGAVTTDREIAAASNGKID